jgi:hypothetical protein
MSDLFALCLATAFIAIIALVFSSIALAWSYAALRKEATRIEYPREQRAWTGPEIGPTKDAGSAQFQNKVPDLPPQAIAPKLKAPPRPKGGFGSKDSNSQEES